MIDRGPGPLARRSLTRADRGLGGHPWPEYLGGRAAIAVPQSPARVVLDSDGWSADPQSLALDWSVVLGGEQLTVRRPGGELWLEESFHLTRDWRRAARVHGVVLLVTGPFAAVTDYRTAETAGALRLLATPVSFAEES